MRSKSYRDDLLESRKKPAETAAYLDASLEDGDRSVFLMAVKDVTDANGGIREIATAAAAHLNRETLYRTLSETDQSGFNPSCGRLAAIRRACC